LFNILGYGLNTFFWGRERILNINYDVGNRIQAFPGQLTEFSPYKKEKFDLILTVTF